MTSGVVVRAGSVLLMIACCTVAATAAAADCKPKPVPPKALRLLKPLLKARIQQARAFEKGQSWDPQAPLSRKVDELFAAVLKDNTPTGDQAVAYLLTVYLGEANGEAIVCDVISRGQRMMPLVQAVETCQPLTGLEPLPASVRGNGALVQMALEALEQGDKPCQFE